MRRWVEVSGLRPFPVPHKFPCKWEDWCEDRRGPYLTRLRSFSSMVMASTRAAALSPGGAVTSQTRLSAKGPSSQSGYRKSCAEAPVRSARTARWRIVAFVREYSPIGRLQWLSIYKGEELDCGHRAALKAPQEKSLNWHRVIYTPSMRLYGTRPARDFNL